MAVNDITGDRLVSRAATEAYRKAYDGIFGSSKPKGGSYIQDKETGKFIPAHEWEAKYGANTRGKVSWQVMPDISPYKSVIDGREITSRSRHRAHLKENGCIEVGNEKQTPNKIPDVPGLKEDIVNSCKKLGYL